MPKRLSPQAILALQEALAVIYHYKNDLRRFLSSCGVDAALLSRLDWTKYKRRIVADLFELLLNEKNLSLDGAFTLDGTDYLFEAKWEKDPLDRAALDEFVSKIGRKLDNTLGLLLSMSGFMPNAVDLHSGRRATLLLMDHYDLQAVLEQRIDFVEMLRRKRRHAAETGSVFFQVYPTVL